MGSVLQFLAHNSATGILEIRDYQEQAYIYLVKGRLEGISMPTTDDRLGVHLIRSGVLDEGQLIHVLIEQEALGGTKGRKPLGQQLVEKGYTTENVIRQAMRRLTMERLLELTRWKRGLFTYDEPAQMPEFQICIRGDVQELLLRAQVAIDEGQRQRRPDDHEACIGCTVTDCSPAVKAKYLRQDLCLWRKMSGVPDLRGDQPARSNPLYSLDESRAEPAMQGGWVAF